MYKIALTVSVLSALSQNAFAGPIRALDTKAPDSSVVRVLDTNFADPSVIKTDDGYYSFATVGGGVNAQVATSKDFKEWKRLDGHDAVPGPFPDWIAKAPAIWAPDVIKRVIISNPPSNAYIVWSKHELTVFVLLGRWEIRDVLLCRSQGIR